jgi:multiple sugar transport system ATP-binding protein
MTAMPATPPGLRHREHRLELAHVTKRFGDFTAVAPLDLHVRPGEMVALLGPAGSGKTTALRLIAGLERPTTGTIHIDGFDVTAIPPRRRDVAMVFSSPALYPHLTVERNLAYPMRAQGIPPHAIARRVEEVLDRLRLEHVRRRKPRHLSPDERQRVSLGRAIVRDAKAMLLDEPLAPFAGDDYREHLRRELRAIHEELRATTVLATRDPLDAMAADRVAVMNEGRIVQCDKPRVLADHPADLFVARYVGVGGATMNFLDARRVDGAVRLACCDVAIAVDDRGAVPVDPDRLTLGIRPADVRIDPGGVIVGVAGATESRGADQLVSLRLGNAVIRTFVPPGRHVAPGERVPVRFEAAGCRWFDATSGKALPWQTARDPA